MKLTRSRKFCCDHSVGTEGRDVNKDSPQFHHTVYCPFTAPHHRPLAHIYTDVPCGVNTPGRRAHASGIHCCVPCTRRWAWSVAGICWNHVTWNGRTDPWMWVFLKRMQKAEGEPWQEHTTRKENSQSRHPWSGMWTCACVCVFPTKGVYSSQRQREVGWLRTN